MELFHGTSAENIQSILVNGFDERLGKGWGCKNPGYAIIFLKNKIFNIMLNYEISKKLGVTFLN